jgi:hypothetical protein
MRTSLKALLALEIVVCFGPMGLMLMMGALLIPIQIIALIDEPLLWEGPVEIISMVLSGAVGLGTVLFLLEKLFDEAAIKRPWLVFAGAIVGVMSLIEPLTSPMLAWRILGAMPVAAGLHVLFLSRRLLFPHTSKS